jgi:4-amino-4-deoxy-L-arabinose transferase-like glycosyltransferase
MATGGVPATLYFGPLPIPIDAYYVHHPTLLPLLETAAFAAFGESEWSARLVPVACSLLSMIFLWLLVSDTINRRAATFAAAVFATLPMELHYGDMVDFEPCLVMLMLATLLCLRYWRNAGGRFWGWMSALCCFLALSMDWPGYLFVLSVAGCFLITGTKGKRQFALVLLGLCGVCGVVFLLQIRHINPAAWSDLWTALKMRLGNGEATGSSGSEAHADVHFTFLEWCGAIRNALHDDFLYTPWILAGLGTLVVLVRRKASEGIRWAGWGALQMAIAGALYVVILRNESFIHDFTTFYLIGSVAILAGICMEGVFVWLESGKGRRWLRVPAILALILWLGYSGYTQSQRLRSQFFMLDGVTVEPPNLIPDLGARLARDFSAETTILCNFDPYTSVLPYYAQRMILNNLTTYDDWKSELSGDTGPFGGIIWLDAPGASEILAALPKNEITPFDLDGFRFALWRPAKQPVQIRK